jgi:hypothetical protein
METGGTPRRWGPYTEPQRRLHASPPQRPPQHHRTLEAVRSPWSSARCRLHENRDSAHVDHRSGGVLSLKGTLGCDGEQSVGAFEAQNAVDGSYPGEEHDSLSDQPLIGEREPSES